MALSSKSRFRLRAFATSLRRDSYTARSRGMSSGLATCKASRALTRLSSSGCIGESLLQDRIRFGIGHRIVNFTICHFELIQSPFDRDFAFGNRKLGIVHDTLQMACLSD